MSLQSELCSFLQTAGVGITGTSLFGGQLPDGTGAADDCVALIETPGARRAYTHDNVSGAWARPHVQVLARSSSALTARSLAERAVTALAGIANATLSGVRYLRAVPLQEPFLLAKDQNGRLIYAVNLELWKVPSG